MRFKEPYTVEEAQEALNEWREVKMPCQECALGDYLEDMIDLLKAKSDYATELEQSLKQERKWRE